MRHASLAQRRWHVHPAHAVVGVSILPSVFRSVGPREAWLADGRRRRLVLRLICGELDGRSAVRLFQCQRLFQDRLKADCRLSFVDLAEGLSQVGPVVPTDCTVLLVQGITILRTDCDLEAELLAAAHATACDWEPGEMAVAPAGLSHPLLNGVGPFLSRSGMPTPTGAGRGGVALLLGRKNGLSRPVAWARESGGERMFHTALGCADDFSQPEFCRILARAVRWVAGDGATSEE